jgi:hypothetical protein
MLDLAFVRAHPDVVKSASAEKGDVADVDGLLPPREAVQVTENFLASPIFSAVCGKSTWWQAMSPTVPVPNSRQLRQLNGCRPSW